MAGWKPDVFEYTDYREYLHAYYLAAKVHSRGFSYRRFSNQAGFSSPNFLKLVTLGQRNLGPESVGRFTKALSLTGNSKRYFERLVEFNQSSTPKEQNEAFDALAAMRRFRQARHIDHDHFTYLSHWYYPAIREMTARPDFQEDAAWIAKQLKPKIKPAQAASALGLIERLGLVERGPDGKLSRGDPSLTTGHEVHSLAIGNYHRQMLERSALSIELFKSAVRDISGLTVCIGPGTVAELKERIHAFREQLLDLCDRDESPESVYQINFQLFPLTETKGDGEDA